MKIRIEKDRIRLQSETEEESQFVFDLLDRLWKPSVLPRLGEDIANDHGNRGGLNWVTLPLPPKA